MRLRPRVHPGEAERARVAAGTAVHAVAVADPGRLASRVRRRNSVRAAAFSSAVARGGTRTAFGSARRWAHRATIRFAGRSSRSCSSSPSHTLPAGPDPGDGGLDADGVRAGVTELWSIGTELDPPAPRTAMEGCLLDGERTGGSDPFPCWDVQGAHGACAHDPDGAVTLPV